MYQISTTCWTRPLAAARLRGMFRQAMSRARDRYLPLGFPFSEQLCAFMDACPAFERSLKLANPGRFAFLGQMITSRTPDGHALSSDQVLGLWYLDMKNFAQHRHPFFKQDFIVNLESASTKFVAYADARTVRAAARCPSVRLIRAFFNDYGDGKRFYHHGERWAHHYDDIGDLPTELQAAGRRLASSLRSPD